MFYIKLAHKIRHHPVHKTKKIKILANSFVNYYTKKNKGTNIFKYFRQNSTMRLSFFIFNKKSTQNYKITFNLQLIMIQYYL